MKVYGTIGKWYEKETMKCDDLFNIINWNPNGYTGRIEMGKLFHAGEKDYCECFRFCKEIPDNIVNLGFIHIEAYLKDMLFEINDEYITNKRKVEENYLMMMGFAFNK